MSVKVLSLLECPFCKNENGGIAVDADALANARATWPSGGHLVIHEQPDQKVFLFNSNRADAGPCEHLVQLHGDFRWGPVGDGGAIRREWAMDFDWGLKEFDPDDQLAELLWHAIDLAGASSMGPRTPLINESFGHEWTDHAVPDGSDRIYSIHAGAVFAQDRKRLFEELHHLATNEEWMKEDCLSHIER